MTNRTTPFKRILVTGGSGFIGSNLIRFLVEETDSCVLNFDCLSYAGNNESLKELEGNPNYQFQKGDLCKPEDLKLAFEGFQPDYVMHLAAESHVDRSIDRSAWAVCANQCGRNV